MGVSKEPIDSEFFILLQFYGNSEFHELKTRCYSMLEQFPNSSKLYNILGGAHTGLEEYDDAMKCYSQALKIRPNYAEAYNNMGNAFKIKGELENAIKCFKKALVLKPNFPEVYNNMGASYQELENFPLAILQFETAIELKHDYIDAYINKGNALRIYGKTQASIQSFRSALKIDPNSAIAHFSLGLSLRDDMRFEEAISSFEVSINIKPNYFEAYNFMGNTLKSIGKTGKAVKVFEKVLAIKEDFFEVHRHLAFAKKFDGSEPQIQMLLDYSLHSNLSNIDLININFTLGKIFEDCKQFEKSYKFLLEGNRLRTKEIKYNIKEDVELFSSIKDRFQGTRKEANTLNKGYNSRKINPIFIIGMPRSGTTLIEQILCSHSNIYGAGELNFLGKSIERSKLVNVDFTKDSLWEFQEYYFEKLESLPFKENNVTDKMPLNFRWCGFILKAMPNAKIIHVKRDRMATCFSIFKSYFSSNGNRYAYDFEGIKAYYNLYFELMNFWKLNFPGKIYELDYEALTEMPEKEIRKLINFTGLKWEDSCLNFHQNVRPVMTLSKTQVREKIYKGSSQGWKNYKQYLDDCF